VVSRLTAVNAIALVAAVISGPILARGLGAAGRGELAAILVVLTITPWLLDLGQAQWVARERAMGAPCDEVLGAALPVAFICSLVGVAAAIPLSHVLGGSRGVVVTYLQVGLFLAPIGVILFTLSGLVIGESRWRLLAATRVVATVVPAIAIVLLSILGDLTVASAAAATVMAMLVSFLLPLWLARGVRLRFSVSRLRIATSFGAKSWLTTISGTANARFDQVLMAALVPSRELGLYAVAVSLSSVTSGLVIAVSNALYPRVSRGDGDLTARSCRVTIAIVATAGGLLAALAVPGVPLVFGNEFAAAVAMVLILLLASLPLSASVVLGSALTAAGTPAAPMRAELVAVVVTIPALVVFLPVYGGVGAAVISLGAYSVRFGMLLRSASEMFEQPSGSFVFPTGGDLRWLAGRVWKVRRLRHVG